MKQILTIISIIILFKPTIYAQSSYLMDLSSPQIVDEKTIEFDVNLRSTEQDFILTSYQCAFNIDSQFLNDTSFCFEYIPSTSQLSNAPLYGIGCNKLDGTRKIHFASSAGEDTITTHPIRVGRFVIKKSPSVIIDTLHINWAFDGIYRTILTGENFQEITVPTDHKSLAFIEDTTSLKNFLLLNSDAGVLDGDVHLKSKEGSNSTQVVYFLNTYSTLTFIVNLDRAGEWFAWGRMFFDTTNVQNSFYFQIDGGTKLTFGNHNQFGDWHWEGAGLKKLDIGNLTQGKHIITIYGREPSETVMLDQILLTADNKLVASDDLFQLTSIAKVRNNCKVFSLSQNYPNPFNPSTNIQYSLNQTCNVKLEIYNLLGEKVTELKNEVQNSGIYKLNWNATNYSSGTYILALYAKPTNSSASF